MRRNMATIFTVALATVTTMATQGRADTSDQHTKAVLLAPGQVSYFSGQPSNHEAIIFGATWDKSVDHNEDEPVDCLSAVAEHTSQCRAVLHIDSPPGATHAILKVKAKSWVTNAKSKGGFNYALIYASAPVPGYIANHFIHTETFGRGPDGQGENRRVEFTNIVVPVVDQSVTIQVGKQVAGKSVVEIAVYLSGFVAAPEIETSQTTSPSR